ncbi:MAG: hypothetical protein HUU20_28410, partial [Pirellulales bacterium]|nr:hypothetical protein [Pirellulales bacterium]
TGLTNGERFAPEETLTIEAEVDAATGQLLVRATGASPAGGVAGLQVPLVNLHAEHRLYVASFGGLYYDRTMDPALISLGHAPFWEAPVVGVEGPRGSLGLWVEDAEFHPHFAFLSYSGRSFSAAIEYLNLMPFDKLKETRSFTWRLDAFAGGWVEAMTPYRDWYARQFAPELKLRAATTWADKIQVVIDHADHTDETYRQVADLFGPETVLFHDWNARAPAFDHDLPDWTPRAGYMDQVKRLHEHGFRAMAYVNTYCVNYNSPVFRRDHIERFGLTRKMQMGRYAASSDSFQTAKDGQLLYLDPLSAEWRRYHTDMMIRWREETGTDANYEDVAGTAGDFGNGVVEGKFAAQGGVEQFRELLRRNPTVPMASEYAPADVAFAVRWPLRYQQVWGGEKTRIWWMQHMRPVSAYLFGPLQRPWIPVIRAESELARHVVVACSDALGGMGQCAATAAEFQATGGMTAHMRQRAALFARQQLEPCFELGRAAPELACTYRDSQGGLYRYFAEANVQQMVGPDGRPLYQRVMGSRELKTPLTLPGWPALVEGRLFGLDPEAHYALMPGPAEAPRVQVHELPENAKIIRCESTAERTILSLAAVDPQGPRSGQVRLSAPAGVSAVVLNDRPVGAPGTATTYDVELPATFALFVGRPGVGKNGQPLGDGQEQGRYITLATGLERGGRYSIPHRAGLPIPGVKQPPTALFLNGGSECELALDYATTVPEQAALEVYVRNRQFRYGNGAVARLYLNGRVVRELDFGPRDGVWDTDVHLWHIPLGRFAGQPLAVTIASDAKTENNADSLWWTAPALVADPEQKERFVRVTEAGEVPEGGAGR